MRYAPKRHSSWVPISFFVLRTTSNPAHIHLKKSFVPTKKFALGYRLFPMPVFEVVAPGDADAGVGFEY